MERTLNEPSSLQAGSRVLDAYVLGPIQDSSSPTWAVHLGWAVKADEPRVRLMIHRQPIDPPSPGDFERCVSILRSLAHPNLAPCVRCGIERSHLIVAEPEIVGSTLLDRLVRTTGRRLSLRETARIVRQTASALASLAARSEPIVHGGLAPETIYLEFPHRDVRIVGIGLAQLLRAAGLEPSSRGPSSYAAPEQFDVSEVLSPAADQFALAAIAFECLAGEQAFPADSAGTLPRLSSTLESRAEVLTSVFHRAWSTRPEDRYADVSAFARAFAEAAGVDDNELDSSALLAPRDSVSRTAYPPAPRIETPRSSRPSLRRALARAQASLDDCAIDRDSRPRTSAPANAECIEIAPWDVESVPAMPARVPTSETVADKPASVALRARRGKHRARRRHRARLERRAKVMRSAQPTFVVTPDADFVVPSLPPRSMTSIPELHCELTSLAPTSIPRLDCQLVSLPASMPDVPCEIGSLVPACAIDRNPHLARTDAQTPRALAPPTHFVASVPPPTPISSRFWAATSTAALTVAAVVAIAMHSRGVTRSVSTAPPIHASFTSSSVARDQRVASHPSRAHGTAHEAGRPAASRSLHDTLQHAVDECGSRFGRVDRHVHVTIQFAAADGSPAQIRVWGPPLRGDFRDCVTAAARATHAPANVQGEWEHDFRLRSF